MKSMLIYTFALIFFVSISLSVTMRNFVRLRPVLSREKHYGHQDFESQNNFENFEDAAILVDEYLRANDLVKDEKTSQFKFINRRLERGNLSNESNNKRIKIDYNKLKEELSEYTDQIQVRPNYDKLKKELSEYDEKITEQKNLQEKKPKNQVKKNSIKNKTKTKTAVKELSKNQVVKIPKNKGHTLSPKTFKNIIKLNPNNEKIQRNIAEMQKKLKEFDQEKDINRKINTILRKEKKKPRKIVTAKNKKVSSKKNDESKLGKWGKLNQFQKKKSPVKIQSSENIDKQKTNSSVNKMDALLKEISNYKEVDINKLIRSKIFNINMDKIGKEEKKEDQSVEPKEEVNKENFVKTEALTTNEENSTEPEKDDNKVAEEVNNELEEEISLPEETAIDAENNIDKIGETTQENIEDGEPVSNDTLKKEETEINKPIEVEKSIQTKDGAQSLITSDIPTETSTDSQTHPTSKSKIKEKEKHHFQYESEKKKDNSGANTTLKTYDINLPKVYKHDEVNVKQNEINIESTLMVGGDPIEKTKKLKLF